MLEVGPDKFVEYKTNCQPWNSEKFESYSLDVLTRPKNERGKSDAVMSEITTLFIPKEPAWCAEHCILQHRDYTRKRWLLNWITATTTEERLLSEAVLKAIDRYYGTEKMYEVPIMES